MSVWKTDAKFHSIDDRAVVRDENNYPVCYVSLNYMEYKRSVNRCHLIAAAPELYEALVHCENMLMRYSIDRIDHDDIENEALTIIRKALSKARGDHN